jgi:hypothetical protein
MRRSCTAVRSYSEPANIVSARSAFRSHGLMHGREKGPIAPIFSITRPRWTLIVPSVVPSGEENCARDSRTHRQDRQPCASLDGYCQGFQTLAPASAASDFNAKGPSTISGTWLPTPHRRTRIVPIEDRTTYHPEIWISSSCNGAMTSLVRLSRIFV